MDNLTHTLLGVVLARAGLNRLAPSSTWMVIAAANVPDIDLVTALGGPLSYLEHHRGWTHAFAYAPVMALLPVMLWWPFIRTEKARDRHLLGAYTASLIGVLSHLLMDWLNVYGVRLLMPVSRAWLRLDWVNIIDIWIWVILLFAVLGPLLGRMVSAEIGAGRTEGRGTAWVGLLLMLLYIGGRGMMHDSAIEALQARMYGGATPQRVAALPSLGLPWRWTGLVETSGFYRIVDVDLFGEMDPESGRTLYKAEPGSALGAAQSTETGRVFADFSQFPLWWMTPLDHPEGAVQVSATDLRFGTPDEGRFQAIIRLTAEHRLLREAFEFNATSGRVK